MTESSSSDPQTRQYAAAEVGALAHLYRGEMYGARNQQAPLATH